MYNAWNHTLFEFAKRPNKAYQWPKSSPPHQPPPRFTRRSQLRFSPAKTIAERWVRRCLLKAHSLLRTGDEAAALAFCHDEIAVPRDSCLEFLHSAVSLFTRHGSFDAALELCNHMIDIGFLLQNKTFMLLLRGGHLQRAEFIDDIRDAMARGGVRMDDLTFKSILDTMVKHRCPPTDLEDALYTYQKSQEKDWVPTVGIFHTIIQAWAFSGAIDHAEHWLAKYRDARQRIHSNDGEPSARDNPRKLYAAVITGLARSKKPVAERIQGLLNIMHEDHVSIDIDIYNMIMRALIQWGMKVRAFRMFEGLLSDGMLRRGSLVIPDAYTFRQIFIALNPRQRHPHTGSGTQFASQQVLPDEISTRRVFSDLIRVSRLRLRTRKPLPHKNLISTATFNCALGTFCAQDDYAAAWTVLALFTWFHIVPDAKTSRIVVNSLLRRMRYEMMSPAHNITDVLWMDRFSNERRSVIAARSDKVMFLDRLYFIGRVSVHIMRHEGFQRYLRPSTAFDEDAATHLEFMIALLRSALQAQLGFQTITFPAAEAEREIGKAMLRARNDMVPRGRSERN